jgi:CheY-like chemotaxis protein
MRGLIQAFEALFFTRKPGTDDDMDDDGVVEVNQRKLGTVLLIDDEQPFCETMAGVLKAAGYNVLTATSGSKGLNMLRYAPRDIGAVLLDHNMPGFTGSDTLPYIHKLCPNVKVIGVTALDPRKTPQTFVDGVHSVVRKPFTSTELIDVLNKVLSDNNPSSSQMPATSPAAH